MKTHIITKDQLDADISQFSSPPVDAGAASPDKQECLPTPASKLSDHGAEGITLPENIEELAKAYLLQLLDQLAARVPGAVSIQLDAFRYSHGETRVFFDCYSQAYKFSGRHDHPEDAINEIGTIADAKGSEAGKLRAEAQELLRRAEALEGRGA